MDLNRFGSFSRKNSFQPTTGTVSPSSFTVPLLSEKASTLAESRKPNLLSTLPIELLLEIFSYLSANESACLGLASKSLYPISFSLHPGTTHTPHALSNTVLTRRCRTCHPGVSLGRTNLHGDVWRGRRLVEERMVFGGWRRGGRVIPSSGTASPTIRPIPETVMPLPLPLLPLSALDGNGVGSVIENANAAALAAAPLVPTNTGPLPGTTRSMVRRYEERGREACVLWKHLKDERMFKGLEFCCQCGMFTERIVMDNWKGCGKCVEKGSTGRGTWVIREFRLLS